MGTRFRLGLPPSGFLLFVLFWILTAVTHAVPTGFVNEVVITGLTQPTQLVMVPDGRIFILEKAGRILVVPPGATQPTTTPLLQINNIVTDGERGLLSMVLASDFATTGQYYVLYSNSIQNHERLARFTAAGGTTNLSSEIVIWEDTVPATGAHQGGSVLIGNDGKLYVSIGDHFVNSTEAQSLQSYHGKVLRLNTDGSAPTDNPFFDGSGPNLDAIWAFGLRNPFRMSVDVPTGRIYIGDVGGNDWSTAIEEVNLLAPGANYGWPTCEEFCQAGITMPAYFYRHNNQGASITGGFVYRGSQFPSNYVGNYFFADYVNHTIRGLTVNGAGQVTGNYNFEPVDGSVMGPYGDIVDLRQGVDGSLYYIEFGEGATGGGQIHRIRYTAGNQPPVAVVAASPRGGPAPLTVAFSSAGSRDPENMPLNYSWDFGDGTTSTLANPSHTYTNNGAYSARLTLSDGVNSVLSAPLAIGVGTPPVASITSPTNGATFAAGDTITFSGSATDPDSGPLPPSRFEWTIVFRHDTHIHPFLSGITGVTSGQFTTPATGHDYSGATSFEIRLTVTDADGLTDTKVVAVFPRKVNLSLSTSPAGLQVALDGISHVTPYTIDTAESFSHLVQAPTQTAGGIQYSFSAWSDGGQATHQVIVPAANFSLQATFAEQPAPPILAYAFDEGSGTVATDASAYNNTGMVEGGAAWTTGKHGGALAFNGTSAKVAVLDANDSFDVQTLTVEAWIFKTGRGFSSNVIAGRQAGSSGADVWVLFYDNDNNAPDSYKFCAVACATGPSSTPDLNTWVHVAATEDGTTTRLYRNGVLVASSPVHSGFLPSEVTRVCIGGAANDSSFLCNSEYVFATIDDFRIYPRALTAGEIQSDMNTPVGGIADTSAPSVTITAPPGGATVSGTNVAVTANASDNVGVVGVQFMLDGVALNAEDTAAPYSTSWNTTTAVNGSHALTATARDAAGNTHTSSTVTVTVNNVDGTPPVISNVSAVATSSTTVVISWTTNEPASSQVEYGQTPSYGTPSALDPTLVTSHAIELSGLSASTTYNARVLSRDGAGNLAASSNFTFNTATVSSLVAAYAFNEAAGSIANDASGLNNNATITSPSWAAGKYGSAVALNGTSSAVSILDTNNSLDVTRLTLEAWLFKTGTGVGSTIIMGRQKGTSFSDLWVLFYDNVGGADVYKFCALACVTGPSATPDMNTWVHIAATEDGATTKLYRNGVLVAASPAHSGVLAPETTRVCIGAGGNDASGACNSEFIAARVDDARLYGVALTAAQIQTDMNTPVGTATDATPPTASITAPANGATVQSTVTVSANAADNVGVVGVQFKIDGANLGAEDTTAPYSISWNTTTATNASHALTAVARDAAGNTTTSTSVTVTVNNSDGTPPTVSISAPANGATVQSTVTVSATASDNVGVVGVQFRLDGANLGAEDTSSPYSVSWNTITATNGTHTLTAIARDAAGNTATATAVTVTVSNASSLVAAYNFDEGAGGTLNDLSGNGNQGTLSGPMWTAAGKNGGALLFDGINDLVNIADAASLNLTAGATLEAWVNPTNLSDWRTVIAKENGASGIAYTLSANDSHNNASRERPTARFRVAGSTREINGPAKLAPNTWTHLAATYDGARIRFYVNGVEVSSQSRTGTIATVASLLRIGGAPGLGAEYFAGMIDDVRIYSRALTVSEIQRDMNTPVAAVP